MRKCEDDERAAEQKPGDICAARAAETGEQRRQRNRLRRDGCPVEEGKAGRRDQSAQVISATMPMMTTTTSERRLPRPSSTSAREAQAFASTMP